LAVALCHIQIAEGRERLGITVKSNKSSKNWRASRESRTRIPSAL
jgi:hypothetical protein